MGKNEDRVPGLLSSYNNVSVMEEKKSAVAFLIYALRFPGTMIDSLAMKLLHALSTFTKTRGYIKKA